MSEGRCCQYISRKFDSRRSVGDYCGKNNRSHGVEGDWVIECLSLECV